MKYFIELKDTVAVKKAKEKIYLTVETPLTEAIIVHVNPEDTLEVIMMQFLQSYPVDNPSSYGFQRVTAKAKSIGRSRKDKRMSREVVWLNDNTKTVKSLGLQSKVFLLNVPLIRFQDILIFKQKDRQRAYSKSITPQVAKIPVFGVTSSLLPHVEDPYNGWIVPLVLVQLKSAIMRNRGMEQEGIFRLAGLESKMKDIKFLLNTGKFVDSNDVMCCASLIKVHLHLL